MNQQKNCLICDDNESLIRFECSDSFCKSCIQQLYQEQIQKQQYNIVCPQCNKQISMKTLNLIFSSLNITHNQQILIGIEKEINKKNEEKFTRCLNPSCSGAFALWKDADYFTCPQCSNSYCVKCRQSKHENLSCIDNLRSNAILKSRFKFLSQAKEKNNQVCPHCLMVVEKNGGCNFITCSSKQCQSKKYFCFKCGIALRKEDHSNHFTDDSSFRGECKVLVTNEWFEKNEIPNNDFACPGCSTQSPLDCKIEGNLIYCKSKNCKDKLFCKICLIQMTNKNVLLHLPDHQPNIELQTNWKQKVTNFFEKLKFF